VAGSEDGGMTKPLDDEAVAALEEEDRLHKEARELRTKPSFSKVDQERLNAIYAALNDLHLTEAWRRGRPGKH